MAIEQLNALGKEVVCITPTNVLCLWRQDNSYVSWKWYINEHGDVVTECGTYMQSTLYNQDEAIEMFHRKMLPYQAADTDRVIDYDKDYEDFTHKGHLITDLKLHIKTMLNEYPELTISY